MSRLMIKNLPQTIKEEYFRSVFATKGEITDVKLCRTKDGKFRRFGFVGYKTEKQAENAMKYFNNSFIDTSRIEVEIARNLGDKNVPRPWSKYSEGSSAFQKRTEKLKNKNVQEGQERSSSETGKEMKKTSKDILGDLNELEEDPDFQEFLSAHQSRSNKSLWSNDTCGMSKGDRVAKKKHTSKKEKSEVKISKKKPSVVFEDSDESDSETEKQNVTGEVDDNMSEHDDSPGKIVQVSKLSDMDYLRTKVVSKTLESSDSDSEEEMADSASESIEDDTADASSSDQKDTDNKAKSEKIQPSTPWTIKMRGLPFKIKDKDIKEFFSPTKVVEIRVVKNKKGQPSGYAFVDFLCKEDLDKALKRDNDYLEGRYIELFRDLGIDPGQGALKYEQDERPWMKKFREEVKDEQDESIGESGRLFIRNLSYSCTEDEIQVLFEKHGPLSEVYLPLDKHTNKTIGIGFVTFLMPEHAVKAFNELDGTVFQGRLLHILPSKAKKTEDEENTAEATSYKKKNEVKKKSHSSSDHNWNTLFLGVNAVADVMADKYNTTKRDILDAKSSHSLAVRMALGETQAVADTRKFLIEQGVKLDVFGQPAAKRSKTVLVAKNLPFSTKPDELKEIFSPFGHLGRLVLPPSGITALIEFPEPSVARKAFQKLAYTKFKNAPLYLEWAPVDVFAEPQKIEKQADVEMEQKAREEQNEENKSGDESETEETEGTTLFVKNLSFDTTEEAFKEKFSQIGTIKSVTVARKKDPKKQGNLLSMGYGFVEFKKKSSALKAIKDLQHSMLDGHALELKLSHRSSSEKVTGRQKASQKKQKSSKILVRNVPFEATTKEIRELFSTFGEIKTLRLPKKLTGTGHHRGFAFVDFLTKQDAKRAFEALCTSTHLYGRRLVLEWAEDEDDVDALRKRTAEHFHAEPKKARKNKEMMDSLLDTTVDD